MILQALIAKLVECDAISEEDAHGMTSIVNLEHLLSQNLNNFFTTTEFEYVNAVKKKLDEGDMEGAKHVMPPPSLQRINKAIFDIDAIIRLVGHADS